MPNKQRKYSGKYMQKSKTSGRDRKRYGVRDADPIAARSVSNYELARSGGFKRPGARATARHPQPKPQTGKPFAKRADRERLAELVCTTSPACKCVDPKTPTPNGIVDVFTCCCSRSGRPKTSIHGWVSTCVGCEAELVTVEEFERQRGERKPPRQKCKSQWIGGDGRKWTACLACKCHEIHASNSRRFVCACGRRYDWPLGGAKGKRAPEHVRSIECACGVTHQR